MRAKGYQIDIIRWHMREWPTMNIDVEVEEIGIMVHRKYLYSTFACNEMDHS